ncbi:MAG: glyoxalase, partial [Muribaculaceae bacterium]|nr:glyoxalase [Muribaculaceae bacterium]
MKLEHVALYVSDLEKAREFFITYFGAASNAMYHNPRTGLRTYYLSFGDAARLEIMQRPDPVAAPFEPKRQANNHSAFS